MLFLGLVSSPSMTSAEGAQAYIPGGQEAQILEMLGGSEEIAGCRLAGADVRPREILATYRCGGEHVARVLRLGLHAESSADAARFFVEGLDEELVSAIGARVRAREGGVRLVAGSEHVPSSRAERPAAEAATRAGPIAMPVLPVLVLLALVLLISTVARRVPRARPALYGVVLFATLAVVLRCVGDAIFLAVLGAQSAAFVTLPFVFFALLLASAALYLFRRGPRTPSDGLACVATACILACIGFAADLGAAREGLARLPRLGTIVTGHREGQIIDDDPRRPRVADRYNARGFRGPDWADVPRPGEARGVVVGDSFVAGMGVAQGDTLSVRLREALGHEQGLRPVEVLNLGIAGNNLLSHVEVLREATARLRPTFAVLCLTLPNDLSAYDTQVELAEGARLGPYALSRFVMGPRFTTWVYGDRLLARSLDARAMRVLRLGLTRLDALMRAPRAVPLFVFTYGFDELPVRDALHAVPNVRVVGAVPALPGYAIVGDGHPTAIANIAYARAIAGTILGDAGVAAALRLPAAPP